MLFTSERPLQPSFQLLSKPIPVPHPHFSSSVNQSQGRILHSALQSTNPSAASSHSVKEYPTTALHVLYQDRVSQLKPELASQLVASQLVLGTPNLLSEIWIYRQATRPTRYLRGC